MDVFMDECMKELIAIGASAAVNCWPCLEFHLAECDRLSVNRNDVKAAIEVGIMVGRGAAGKTKSRVAAMLDIQEDAKGGAGGCSC